MATLPLVDPEKAEGKAADLLKKVKAKLGRVPNAYRALANLPQWAEKLMALSAATYAPGALDVKTKHLIAVAVSATNSCFYCVKAHTVAAQAAGATKDEVSEALATAACMSAYNTFVKGADPEEDFQPNWT